MVGMLSQRAARLLLQGVPPSSIIPRLVALPGVNETAALQAIDQAVSGLAQDLHSEKRRNSLQFDLLETLRQLRQADPHASIIDSAANIKPEEFYSEYVHKNRPVLLRGFVQSWPACGKWTPRWFADEFGMRPVEIMADRDAAKDYDSNRSRHQATIPLNEFIAFVEAEGGNDKYMTGANGNLFEQEFQALLSDVVMDPGIFKQQFHTRLLGLWIGGAGTVTKLHYDRTNNILCQIYGQKKIILIPALESHLVGKNEYYFSDYDPERLVGGQSIDKATISTVVLDQGDAIFIPVGWWHHVRSLTPSISLALNNLHDPNNFPL